MASALLVALAMAGCGENPARDVPKANVESAKLPPDPAHAKPAPAPAAVSASPKPAEPAKDAVKDDAKDQPKAASAPAPAAGAVALAIDPATSKVEFIGSKKIGGRPATEASRRSTAPPSSSPASPS